MADHQTIRGGVDSSAVYKIEATYGSDPGTWTANAAHFGLSQSVTPSISRNLVKLRGLSGVLPTAYTTSTSRDAKKIVGGKAELSVNVEYQPQEFSFLKFVMGSTSTHAGDGIYYPQKAAATYADELLYTKVPSFSMVERFNFNSTGDAADTALTFTGLKVNTWELSASIGEPCKVTSALVGSDILYSQASVDTNYPFVALSSEDVYHFINSEVKFGATAYPNLLNGFTLTINNNATGLGDLRKYTNQAVVTMARDFTLKVNGTFENITFLKNFLGASAVGLAAPTLISAVTLILDKGEDKNLYVYLVNLKQADGVPGVTYGEVAKEELTLEAEYCYFIENNEA